MVRFLRRPAALVVPPPFDVFLTIHAATVALFAADADHNGICVDLKSYAGIGLPYPEEYSGGYCT